MAKATTPTKAYSYLRFSTPEQMQGDSLRRQVQAAKDYAKTKGLELDESLSYRDLGVSAFRGANVQEGALAQFLYAVEKGIVVPGSCLLVENIDRLSRRAAWDALQVLQAIVNKGVAVVTLMDRQEYSQERLRREPWCFLQAYGAMIRAHEESATKSRRAKEAYRAAVAKAQSGDRILVSPKFPSWLRYDGTKFLSIPERVVVVRRIFRLARQGVGKDSMAARFNREHVPLFGKGKHWYGSFITKTLSNRAVLGEYHPQEREYHEGKRTLISLGKIRGYYPAIISRHEFERVQALTASANNPRRGRHARKAVSNVLGGLARCPLCDSTMTRIDKGKQSQSRPLLVCTKAKTGAGCRYHGIPYQPIEDAIFERAEEILTGAPEALPKGRDLRKQLNQVSLERDAVTDAIENLTNLVEAGRGGSPSSVRQRLTALEDELDRLTKQSDQLQAQLSSLAPSVVSYRLKELQQALQDRRNLTRANIALRLVLESVIVDYRQGLLRFLWKHGAESSILWAWPRHG